MARTHAVRLFTGLAATAVVVISALGMAATTHSQAPTIRQGTYQALVSVEGKDNFLAYCAVCHGITGKGGGPAVPALKVPVPDLTTMAKRYGKYDAVSVENQILGRDKMPAAHGSVDMPMWGPIFKSRGDETVALLRTRNLAAYIGTLQAK
ncbi:cytochrome c [Luteitalea sp.]|uniref:c-type cytochrome n=1 Tax=Luteitalea sp. TaxID=2004800 RepID=UPI0025C309E6|nr:cytochrome c [Luteitalea sp.]